MSDDYEVGYGKPPKDTRFKKGESGNPAGRPKGTKNFKTDFIEELGARIRVREGGKSVTMSKQRALFKALVAMALQGNLRALHEVNQLALRFSPEESEAVDGPLGREDQELMDAWEKQLMAGALQGVPCEAGASDEEGTEKHEQELEQEGENK